MTMNRQAVPSILVSVSIVCFFAVALYPREPKPRGPGRPDVARPAGPEGPASTGPVATTADNPAERRPAPPSGASPGPTAPVKSIAASGSRTGEAPVPAFRLSSKQAARGRPSPGLSPSAARPTAPKRDRGAFTVVGSGESIADVARRVYGTTEGVESLWRANRDILSEPDAPLATGTVLHTPGAPLR
jgi:nucleoid-associated protein YgaU